VPSSKANELNFESDNIDLAGTFLRFNCLEVQVTLQMVQEVFAESQMGERLFVDVKGMLKLLGQLVKI
jgi:hypothetical protein